MKYIDQVDLQRHCCCSLSSELLNIKMRGGEHPLCYDK